MNYVKRLFSFQTAAIKMTPQIARRDLSKVKRNSCFNVIQMNLRLRQKAKELRKKQEENEETPKHNVNEGKLKDAKMRLIVLSLKRVKIG